MPRIILLLITGVCAAALISCKAGTNSSCESRDQTEVYDSIPAGQSKTLAFNSGLSCSDAYASGSWQMYGSAKAADYLDLQTSRSRLEVTGHCATGGLVPGVDTKVDTVIIQYPTIGAELKGLSLKSLCGDDVGVTWTVKIVNNSPVSFIKATLHFVGPSL